MYMETQNALFDHLYRGKVLRARRTDPADRWLASMALSDDAVATMKEGVRAEFPLATEGEILSIIRSRLNRIRRASRRE
jgi:hypothetical protein